MLEAVNSDPWLRYLIPVTYSRTHTDSFTASLFTVYHIIVAKTLTRYCTSQDPVVNLRALKSLSSHRGPTAREARLRRACFSASNLRAF
jgi:hypothetical protein